MKKECDMCFKKYIKLSYHKKYDCKENPNKIDRPPRIKNRH